MRSMSLRCDELRVWWRCVCVRSRVRLRRRAHRPHDLLKGSADHGHQDRQRPLQVLGGRIKAGKCAKSSAAERQGQTHHHILLEPPNLLQLEPLGPKLLVDPHKHLLAVPVRATLRPPEIRSHAHAGAFRTGTVARTQCRPSHLAGTGRCLSRASCAAASRPFAPGCSACTRHPEAPGADASTHPARSVRAKLGMGPHRSTSV